VSDENWNHEAACQSNLHPGDLRDHDGLQSSVSLEREGPATGPGENGEGRVVVDADINP
jgi:hypothetical protein